MRKPASVGEILVGEFIGPLGLAKAILQGGGRAPQARQ